MCQLGPIGAKSYFLPDHCHIRREGTFLEVLNSGEVRFSKIWLLDPIWPPLQWPGGANWGQILFFAQSSPYSQGRDLFESFEQWWSQIFEILTFGPHLAPPSVARWGQLGPNPIFCPIIAIFAGKGRFWKTFSLFISFKKVPSLSIWQWSGKKLDLAPIGPTWPLKGGPNGV